MTVPLEIISVLTDVLEHPVSVPLGAAGLPCSWLPWGTTLGLWLQVAWSPPHGSWACGGAWGDSPVSWVTAIAGVERSPDQPSRHLTASPHRELGTRTAFRGAASPQGQKPDPPLSASRYRPVTPRAGASTPTNPLPD